MADKSDIVTIDQPSAMQISRAEATSALMKKEVLDDFVSAYQRLLKSGNSLIVKDYADRVLGKPKDQVELSGEVSTRPMAEVPVELLLQLAKLKK